jgi:hypothetical protein
MFLLVSGCQIGTPLPELKVIDKSLEPLRQRFNADRGRIRVLALFSPV